MAQRGTPLQFQERERIRRLVAAGKSQREIARLLRLARETVRKYGRAKQEKLCISLGH